MKVYIFGMCRYYHNNQETCDAIRILVADYQTIEILLNVSDFGVIYQYK